MVLSIKNIIYTMIYNKFFRLSTIFSIAMITLFSFSPSSMHLSAILPIDFLKDYSNNPVLAQQTNSSNNISTKILVNDTWTSKRDNLSIIIKLEPATPIIDQWTKMHFEIKELGSGNLVEKDTLTVNATISDHDGRLFKFPEQQVIDGRFNISYIFPDDGQHRIILQLYKNNTALTVAAFDMNIPHPQPPKSIFERLFQSQPY